MTTDVEANASESRQGEHYLSDDSKAKPRKRGAHSFPEVTKSHLFWNANIIVKFFMLIFSPLLLIFGVVMYFFTRYKSNSVLKKSKKSGAMRQINEGVWVIQGFFPGAGADLPVTMGIVRLPEGGLMLWSAVFGHEETIAEVRALKEEVKLILIPNSFHDSYIEDWRLAFPEAQILCPATAFERTEKFTYPTGTCEDVLPAQGVEVISHCHITREPMQENCYVVPMADGKKLMLTSDIVATCNPLKPKDKEVKCQHPRPFIPMFVLDTAALAAHLKDRLATRGADVLIPLHGDEVVGAEKIKGMLEAMAEEGGGGKK